MDIQEPTQEQRTETPVVHEPRYWLITLLAVIVTASIAGGGVWRWMSSRLVAERFALESQVQTLEAQVVVLEQQIGQDDKSNDIIVSDNDSQMVSDDDWRVFQNKRYGYTISYPPDWSLGDLLKYPSVEEESHFAVEFFDVERYESQETPYAGLRIDIDVNDYPYEENRKLCNNLVDCVEGYNELKNHSYTIIDQQNIMLAGENAISQVVDRKQHGWKHLQTFLLKNGNFYIIKFTTSYNTYEADVEEYNGIIKTFRILDE